jgi:hypothetical protein
MSLAMSKRRSVWKNLSNGKTVRRRTIRAQINRKACALGRCRRPVTALGTTIGIFAASQPRYAAVGIPTFPVDSHGKKPMVSNYAKFGLRGSAELARKFGTATGIGFMAGERSRISVVDIDTRNETVLVDALDRHGQTPIIARTGSGKFHAYYRHNGEHRMIRPEKGPSD